MTHPKARQAEARQAEARQAEARRTDGAICLEWHGETLELLPNRALFWPRRRTLLVADVHLGKEGTFQAAGFPVPDGGSTADHLRLEQLAEAVRAETLIVLGDLVHDAEGWGSVSTPHAPRPGPPAGPPVARLLVPGNHDRGAPEGAARLGFRVVDASWPLGPFTLCHAPPESNHGSPWIAGHLHPTFTLRGPGDCLRAPCFVVTPSGIVLPAFGGFTGGVEVHRAPKTRIFLVPPLEGRAPDSSAGQPACVFEVPA